MRVSDILSRVQVVRISVLNFCFTLNAEIVLSEDDRPEALGDFRTSEILCRCLASGRVSAHDQSD